MTNTRKYLNHWLFMSHACVSRPWKIPKGRKRNNSHTTHWRWEVWVEASPYLANAQVRKIHFISTSSCWRHCCVTHEDLYNRFLKSYIQLKELVLKGKDKWQEKKTHKNHFLFLCSHLYIQEPLEAKWVSSKQWTAFRVVLRLHLLHFDT